MQIAIDVREAVNPKRTGKGQWARGCIDELCTREHDFIFYTDANVPDEWKLRGEVIQFPSGLSWHFRVAHDLRKRNVDLYLSPTSFLVPFLIGSNVPYAPVIHDMIAFRSDPHEQKASWIEKLTIKRTLKNAAHVFTISQSTANDLQSMYPDKSLKEKMKIVYAGPLEVTPPKTISDDTTIFCPGTLCPRKNQLRLIKAYSMLPDTLRNKYKLILVGKRGWNDAEIVQAAEETDGVTWKQYVSGEEYESLLQTCAILAFPSMYEGFGLPVLDAMQRGIPVLTSKMGSLEEVAGDAAVLVEPQVTCSIQKGLQQILSDAQLRDELREKGFTQAEKFNWKNTVDAMLSSLT